MTKEYKIEKLTTKHQTTNIMKEIKKTLSEKYNVSIPVTDISGECSQLYMVHDGKYYDVLVFDREKSDRQMESNTLQ